MEASERKSTAERILEAAANLFCQVGYDGVSVRDVAVAADVNKASVFYHFKSKEGLFERVITGYYEAQRDVLKGAFTSSGTLRERLVRVIDDYLDFIYSNRQYPRLIQGLVGREQHRGHLQQNMETLFGFVCGMLDELAPPHGPLAARQLFVTFSGAIVHYVTHGPLVAEAWGGDPFSKEELEQRRQHLHWLANHVIDELERLEGGADA